jgi:hypothetical protein
MHDQNPGSPRGSASMAPDGVPPSRRDCGNPAVPDVTAEHGSEFPALHSVLFSDPRYRDGVDERPMPAFFTDVNLDQVVASLVRGREA